MHTFQKGKSGFRFPDKISETFDCPIPISEASFVWASLFSNIFKPQNPVQTWPG
jgi:hypothetical protein